MKQSWLLGMLLVLLLAKQGQSQTAPRYWEVQKPTLTPLYGHSSDVDREWLKKFQEGPYLTQPLEQLPHPPQEGAYLYLDTTKIKTNSKGQALYHLFIVNNGTTPLSILGRDNYLEGGAEVHWSHGWVPIHQVPEVFCGNSFHIVSLAPQEFWQMEVPIYNGPKTVKLRYQLTLTDETVLHSNEVPMNIHQGQLDFKTPKP